MVTNVGSPVAGSTGNPISFGNQSTSGVYTVVATNATTGCTNNMTGSATVTSGTAPTVTVNSPSRCASGAAVTIAATPTPAGTYTYTWTVPAGQANPGNLASFSATIAGTYGVTISNGGCTATGSGILTVTSAPTVSVNSASRCSSGPAAMITATPTPAGAYTYAWTVPAGAINPGNVASFPATVAGTYGVTISSGGCTASGAGVLTVTSTLPIVQAITGTATVCSGNNTQLSDATPGGIWSTSNSAVATVSNTGLVHGISGGTATISYTVTNGCGSRSAGLLVTVNAPPVVAAITGGSSVCPGNNLQLADATSGGTWSSSNMFVAWVNFSGKVTGISPGTVTISYSKTNACGTTVATKVVAVNCFRKDQIGASSGSIAALDVLVAPNPSSNFFTLVVQSTNPEVDANIRVFDMSGRLLDEKRAPIGAIHPSWR